MQDMNPSRVPPREHPPHGLSLIVCVLQTPHLDTMERWLTRTEGIQDGHGPYYGAELAGQPTTSDLPFEPYGFTSKSLARSGRDSHPPRPREKGEATEIHFHI
jgi:hypothetical protein